MRKIEKFHSGITKAFTFLISVSAAVFLVAAMVRAWTEPGVVPPGGNVDTPVNIGPVDQTKEGGLNVATTSGRLGVGTATPGYLFEVAGKAKVTDKLFVMDAIGIGTTGPSAPLEISSTNDAILRLRQDEPGNPWNYIEFYNDTVRQWYMGQDTDGDFRIWDSDSNTGLLVENGGNVGIGTTDPAKKLDIFSTEDNWTVRVNNTWGGVVSSEIHMAYSRGYGMAIYAGTLGNEYALELYNPNGLTNTFRNNGVTALGFQGNVGIGTINPTYKLHVNGDTYSDNYFCAASDIAEKTPSTEEISAGEVVCLSEKREGYLSRCQEPYDSKVAGVVSTDPGITLGDNPDIVEIDNVELALAGRVPVKVTNEGGDIGVGDLLVSSSRPGYAMKGNNKLISERPGVVLGKAMESFTGEKGEILALINLR